MDLADLKALQKYLAPEYRPRPEPLVMIVGPNPISLREASVIKLFHAGLDSPRAEDSVRVVGVNQIDHRARLRVLHHIQRQRDGDCSGLDPGFDALITADARMGMGWEMGQTLTKRSGAYDLIYLRRPFFSAVANMALIMTRAYCFMDESSVVAMLVDRDDRAEMHAFFAHLRPYGVAPDTLVSVHLEGEEAQYCACGFFASFRKPEPKIMKEKIPALVKRFAEDGLR